MGRITSRIGLPAALQDLVDRLGVSHRNGRTLVPESREHLVELAMGGAENNEFEVAYATPGAGRVVEATVTRCRNGLVVNYPDPYLRRRDPDCMVVADSGPTDKERFEDRYGVPFDGLRSLTLDWLSRQDLILLPFWAGDEEAGYPAVLIAPENAGFFAAGLADLQGFIPAGELDPDFSPRAVIYLAPTFRHTHFGGRQMVVHNRRAGMYEMFSYNLYPGPSAKKGVYGVLLHAGEEEGWVTAHGSTVQVVTPYENVITIMHEGASGGGKSEMVGEMHRQPDGRVLLGRNLDTREDFYLDLKETCGLRPVTDDMAICHPSMQGAGRKLVVRDAEAGWFLRTDHIRRYGTDPYLEGLCVHPPGPLIFMNYDAAPGSTCLIWEHAMDAPGKPCPNPRVIMPRGFVPDVVAGPVEVDVRSFGVRTPPCTREAPSYGIIGMLHVLPPALAWLWRLVAPRGHANPSVTDNTGMKSEGVGSYWPFATGRRVAQANLLLRQMADTPDTRCILLPNQHIGAYHVGFMPQWIAREYLARRGGARFAAHQLVEARCSLLGYALDSMKVDGTYLPHGLLSVERQPEVGIEGYDAGAAQLDAFFREELAAYQLPELDPLGSRIIECFLDGGQAQDYAQILPMRM